MLAAAAVVWSIAPTLGLAAHGAVAPPEPTLMLLFGGGLLGCAGVVRRRRALQR